MSSQAVPGRAYVVPGSISGGEDGLAEGGNVNNFRAKSRVRESVLLVPAVPGLSDSRATDHQRVKAKMPNWLRIVLRYAGTNYGPWDKLPDEVHLPVLIDPATGQITAVDVDLACTELEPYREVATRFWKQTEAVLAPVRTAVWLPGAAIRGAREFVADWKGAISDIGKSSVENDRPPKPKEAEQARRTARQLGHALARQPEQHAKVRASALEAGPMMADGVRGGVYPRYGFISWLEWQELSTAITPEEAAGYRERAGLDAPDGE